MARSGERSPHPVLRRWQRARALMLDEAALEFVNCYPRRDERILRPEALVAAGLSEDAVQLEFVSGAGHSDTEPGLVD